MLFIGCHSISILQSIAKTSLVSIYLLCIQKLSKGFIQSYDDLFPDITKKYFMKLLYILIENYTKIIRLSYKQYSMIY